MELQTLILLFVGTGVWVFISELQHQNNSILYVHGIQITVSNALLYVYSYSLFFFPPSPSPPPLVPHNTYHSKSLNHNSKQLSDLHNFFLYSKKGTRLKNLAT